MTWEQGYSTYLKRSFSSHRYVVEAWKNVLMVDLTPHHQSWGFLTPFGAEFLTDNYIIAAFNHLLCDAQQPITG